MKWAFLLGLLFVAFATAFAEDTWNGDEESSAGKITLENDIEFDSFDTPKSGEESKSEETSDESGKPAPPQQGIISRIFSSVLSVPRSIFRAIGGFFTSAPLSRLREEMKNLNITYPK